MPELLIVGCGEVGVAYAEGLRKLDPAPKLHLLDPTPSADALALAESAGIAVHHEPGRALMAADAVLLATPGGALEQVLDALLPHLPTGIVVADLSTATAEAKQQADARCRGSQLTYVDVAITGSVALTGSATPLLYAGPDAPTLIEMLQQLGAPLTVLSGARPGDAMRVKLLRSVIMKGLEGLAVECLPAAEEFGVSEALWDSLSDVDKTGFVPLLRAMIRTHPRHAARREHEVAEAAAQLESIGYPSTLTRATERLFSATNAAAGKSFPEQDGTDGVISWLRSTNR
ncbi:DUF1932 domain-containing protein [Saccharopolyspora sp. WRP15-2]|uniref:DUF1932 domain-containing protein n=1 Tax=Saccharopolyspora oryzae TaxID=2997343 RepID=A0ABT4UWJ5_9PSEU|nr:DUF1932 domain-containing protein [Saccharopolyspora oryzae]MDA3626097.1 DUF1932 domain-containing protein [Saccharopolyspora oryzae]